jgi:hypothetical protein
MEANPGDVKVLIETYALTLGQHMIILEQYCRCYPGAIQVYPGALEATGTPEL